MIPFVFIVSSLTLYLDRCLRIPNQGRVELYNQNATSKHSCKVHFVEK